MTLRTPPSWLQNGSHPAENDRLTTQALYASTGIIGASSLAVTANSPAGMSVIVASGWAAIVGTTQSNMGTYVAYNDAANVLTVTTADPTNPRIDIVCVTVQDAYYTGAFNDVIFQVIAGTPAGSPTAPATPANSIKLANIAVGAAVTSITTANITDQRVDVTTNLPAPQLNFSVNTQTGTTYTTVLADNGKLVTQSNASAITTTIPPNSSVDYSVGSQITFAQYGAGQVTIQGGAGVTIVSTGATAATPRLRAQYSTCTAIQTSNNNWLVVGDIT
jgi:hypothetical protein